jgi:hypothetical protein
MVIRSCIGIGLQRVGVRRGVAKVGHKWGSSEMLVRIAYRLGALQMKIISQYCDQWKRCTLRAVFGSQKGIPA